MSPRAKSDDRIGLILDEAIRAIEHQQKVLDSIRARITWIVASSAIVTSFLGAPVFRNGSSPLSIPTTFALLAFFGVLLCSFIVGSPTWNWRFRSSPSVLLEWVDADVPLDRMRRELAILLEAWTDENEKKIEDLGSWFKGALFLLLVEVLAWSVELGIVR